MPSQRPTLAVRPTFAARTFAAGTASLNGQSSTADVGPIPTQRNSVDFSNESFYDAPDAFTRTPSADAKLSVMRWVTGPTPFIAAVLFAPCGPFTVDSSVDRRSAGTSKGTTR